MSFRCEQADLRTLRSLHTFQQRSLQQYIIDTSLTQCLPYEISKRKYCLLDFWHVKLQAHLQLQA